MSRLGRDHALKLIGGMLIIHPSRTSGGSADTLNSCCVEIGGILVPELVVVVGTEVGVVRVPFAKSKQ